MENAQPKPLGVLVCRLFWILLGPAFLFLTAASILMSNTGWLTGKDLLFGVLLLSHDFLSLGRFLERRGNQRVGRSCDAEVHVGLHGHRGDCWRGGVGRCERSRQPSAVGKEK